MKTTQENSNKTTSYRRMGIIMLLSAAGGGILGFLSFFFLDGRINGIESGMTDVLSSIQHLMVPLLITFTVITVILGEINIRKLRTVCQKILESEDEECDQWEYEEEKYGAFGMIVNILSQILCALVLSVGYSVKYIADGNHTNVLAACIIFLGCYAYDGFWQVRYVKTVQKAHPEKKGDPSSRKFHQQWLDSCDEAEKEVIYQSAYKAYMQMNTWIPVLLVIAMLGHLFFDTGIMAIVMVAAIWLIVAVSYLRSCVSMKGAKLRE